MSAVPSLPESLAASNGVVPPAAKHRHDSAAGQTNGFVKGHGNDAYADAYDTSATSPFQLHEAPIENLRPIKVIVIGAGYSGVYCGIRIPEKLRNVELVVYEKNEGVGGTWWENRYPGCACDIPSHSYQYSFEPNVEWSSLYAPAREIQAYIERTAKKYGADRFIKLSHQVKECNFDKKEGKWHVKVEDLNTGRVFEDVAEVLISARGNLNHIAWPEIEGLQSFKGEVMHSAKWNEDYDFTNKRIGVIGSGSSAIQIIPNLQKVAGTQLSCFIRGKTWISPPFGQDTQEKLGLSDFTIPDELKAKFKADPNLYYTFRKTIEEESNAIHDVTIRDTPMNLNAKAAFESHMRARLATHPSIYSSLLPTFSPGCRRLTPGPGFLESLTQPNVAFLPTPIASITPTGILTTDDVHHPLDALICATGFHVSSPPPFPVTVTPSSSDNKTSPLTLSHHWRHHPSTYLSLATSSFPNLFLMLGPNSAIGSGSLTTMIEATGDHIVRLVRKLQRDNIRSMSPRASRVRDFAAYSDAYFARTVFAEECRSWYRDGRTGRVTGLWPGSTLHCIEALRSPRWEDWEYEYIGEGEEEGNRMAWLGDGWTEGQREGRDLAWYLYPEFLERPVEGRPEEKGTYKVRPFAY